MGHTQLAYYLVMFVAFVFALVVNFLGIFGFRSYLDGSSLAANARKAVLPIMPAELFSALLTMAVAYVALEAGTTGIVLAGLVLLIFQYLVGRASEVQAARRQASAHRATPTS